MFKRLAVLISLVLLGCSQVGPTTLHDPHLPGVIKSSAAYEAGRTRNAFVTVRAMQSTTTAGTSYALGVIVARSDLNYPKIDQLRRFGRRLPYRRLDRHRIGYLRAEVGLIPLTKAQFDDLAGSGISFRIYGRRGPYDAAVPGRIFENIGASGDE